MSERPYTEAQLRFIKVKKKEFTEKDFDFLRRMLLPRVKYLPDTEDECFALAQEILGEEKYAKMRALLAEVEERYQTEGRVWSAGDHFAKLYCRVKKFGRTFCAFNFLVEDLYLSVYFNAAERDRFEEERENFPRAEICWTYDICATMANGIKCVRFNILDEVVCKHVFALLDFKLRIAAKGKRTASKENR